MPLTDPTAPAPPAAEAAALSAARDALIERWFVESFHDSDVARDTAVFNLVRLAVDRLKAQLQQGV